MSDRKVSYDFYKFIQEVIFWYDNENSKHYTKTEYGSRFDTDSFCKEYADKLKSELLTLILKALPGKKENTDYEEIATKYPDVPKTIPDMYETGYNQALEDTKEAIRKVLA